MSAFGGGFGLATGGLPIPISLLRNTPFDSYLVPGLVLGVVIGGRALAGTIALVTHSLWSLRISAAAGVIMIGWIIGETILIEGVKSWLQGLYLLTGVLVVALTSQLTTSTTTTPRRPTPDPVRT